MKSPLRSNRAALYNAQISAVQARRQSTSDLQRLAKHGYLRWIDNLWTRNANSR